MIGFLVSILTIMKVCGLVHIAYAQKYWRPHYVCYVVISLRTQFLHTQTHVQNQLSQCANLVCFMHFTRTNYIFAFSFQLNPNSTHFCHWCWKDLIPCFIDVNIADEKTISSGQIRSAEDFSCFERRESLIRSTKISQLSLPSLYVRLKTYQSRLKEGMKEKSRIE